MFIDETLNMVAMRFIVFVLVASVWFHPTTSRVIREPSAARSAGKVIPGRHIIVYRSEAGDAAAATQRLLTELKSTSMPTATASGVTVLDDSRQVFKSWKVIGEAPAAAGHTVQAQDASISAESAAAQQQSAVSSRGVQAIVADDVSDTMLAAIRSSALVQQTIPDVWVGHAITKLMPLTPERQCATTTAISAGVESKYVLPTHKELKWPDKKCRLGTKAVWVGERCGEPNFDKIAYTAVYAVNKNTGIVKKVSGKTCEIFPDAKNATQRRLLFGECGVKPSIASDLMTFVCTNFGCISASRTATAADMSASSGLSARLALKRPVRCGTKMTDTLTYSGVRCGPQRQFVQWTAAVGPDGCKVSYFGPKSNSYQRRMKDMLDTFGSCGSGPGLSYQQVSMSVCDEQPPPPSPSPRPKPSPNPNPLEGQVDWFPLKKASLQAGENVPRGIKMIEAVNSDDMIADVSTVQDARRVVVGVIDSGIDITHPDLNYVGGKSWVTVAPDDDPGVDRYGHGTHVAGIIGAMNGNSSSGVVGVSPGTGVFSLKVLDGNGQGMLSKTLDAVKWVTTEGHSKHKISVINLSLVASFDKQNPSFPNMVNALCRFYQDASDAGVTIVAAAGNYASSIETYVPAFCPTVVTVTALDQDGVTSADWSNFASSSSDEQKAHTIAAPGTGIVSTVPKSVDQSGYYELGGTSMASPHVAGVAANCIMAGECSGPTGAANIFKLQKSAKMRAEAGNYVKYDPKKITGDKFYGYLVWAGY